MDISPKDFVSFQDVLSDALVLCHDEDYRNGFTRGYYVSTIQRGLEELGFDTFYKIITQDINLNATNFSTCFQIEVPCNIFNIREMYLFNGSCEQPESQVNVYWKRNLNNGKGGANYTAHRVPMGQSIADPYMPMSFVNSNVYYANVENGIIMFGNNCTGYEWLRIVGNGAGSAIGDDPVIPRFFRTVLSDYVCEKYYRAQVAKDRNYIQDWKIYEQRLNGPNGSWNKAEKRIKRLNTFQRDTTRETVPLWASGGNWYYGL